LLRPGIRCEGEEALEQAMYKAVAEREKLLRRTGAGDRLRSSATIANAENSANSFLIIHE
jgi:hypothetical protein